MGNTIQIASAILLNANKDLLVVRKKKSSFYMLPGGKIEPHEELIDTLVRELEEELGLQFNKSDFIFLGTHRTVAANEDNTMVEGNIFLLKVPLELERVSNYAEIEEVCWMSKKNYKSYQLAHLLSEYALPKWLADFS